MNSIGLLEGDRGLNWAIVFILGCLVLFVWLVWLVSKTVERLRHVIEVEGSAKSDTSKR